MGGGGGYGHFSGTIGAGGGNAFPAGTMYAQAGNPWATDAGGSSPKPWNRNAAIQHLDSHVEVKSIGKCATYVREAIEAGGIRLNRNLNPTGKDGSAHGYGPVLEGAGFKPLPEGTPPQAGDVVLFPKSPGYKHGHAAMFNGKEWISDFKQDNIYPSRRVADQKVPYVIYRRP